MVNMEDNQFIEKVMNIIDRWSFEMCAFCENSSLVTIEGMVDYKCEKCKRKMSDGIYLGEIAKLVYDYRENEEF
ncbi:MAG: hypothetical protein ACFFBP_07250 [Promethearchaeota archaeon]